MGLETQHALTTIDGCAAVVSANLPVACNRTKYPPASTKRQLIVRAYEYNSRISISSSVGTTPIRAASPLLHCGNSHAPKEFPIPQPKQYRHGRRELTAANLLWKFDEFTRQFHDHPYRGATQATILLSMGSTRTIQLKTVAHM